MHTYCHILSSYQWKQVLSAFQQMFAVSTFERLDTRQRWLLLCWTFQRRLPLLKLTWRQVRGHNLTLGDTHADSPNRFLCMWRFRKATRKERRMILKQSHSLRRALWQSVLLFCLPKHTTVFCWQWMNNKKRHCSTLLSSGKCTTAF